MAGFKPWVFGTRSDRSTNCAATNAPTQYTFLVQFYITLMYNKVLFEDQFLNALMFKYNN